MILGENSLVAAYQGRGQLKSRPSGTRVVTNTYHSFVKTSEMAVGLSINLRGFSKVHFLKLILTQGALGNSGFSKGAAIEKSLGTTDLRCCKLSNKYKNEFFSNNIKKNCKLRKKA